MNTQSEALRLADALDFGDSISVKANADTAAAELRRLHVLNAQLTKVSEELLEALKGVLVWGTDEDWKNAKIWCEKARAAIARAKGTCKAEGEQA